MLHSPSWEHIRRRVQHYGIAAWFVYEKERKREKERRKLLSIRKFPWSRVCQTSSRVWFIIVLHRLTRHLFWLHRIEFSRKLPRIIYIYIYIWEKVTVLALPAVYFNGKRKISTTFIDLSLKLASSSFSFFFFVRKKIWYTYLMFSLKQNFFHYLIIPFFN